MELRQLRYFVAVAEHGHMTRAARWLHVAQPAVSQGLRQLERELGVVLFERTSRGMTLTDSGQRLLPDAKAALDHAQRVLDIASQAVRGRVGALHVGYLPFVTDRLVTAAVQRLRLTRPEVEVVLHEVAFLAGPGPPPGSRLDVVLALPPLGQQDLVAGPVVRRGGRVLAVPAGHPLEARAPLRADDLAGQTVATAAIAPPAPWADYWLPATTPGGGEIRRGPVMSTVGEILTAVAAGQVVQLFPSEVARVYRRGEISFLEIDIEGYEVVPMWLPGSHGPLVQAFVGALAEADEAR